MLMYIFMYVIIVKLAHFPNGTERSEMKAFACQKRTEWHWYTIIWGCWPLKSNLVINDWAVSLLVPI